MIVGISGAQGQGKTTVIKKLVELYPDEYYDFSIQTSRNLLADYDLTLDQINKYLPLKVQYQDRLFRNHLGSIKGSGQATTLKGKVRLIDRTFSDIFVYALVSVGAFNEYSVWLNSYYEDCKNAQKELDGVFYLTGRDYTPEYDSVRSTNIHFSSMVDQLIRKYTFGFANSNGIVEMVEESDLEKRVEIIHNNIQKIKNRG